MIVKYFHQYQQNKQSPLTSTQWTYNVENTVPVLGQLHKKCGRFRPVHGLPILNYWIPSGKRAGKLGKGINLSLIHLND